MKHEYPSVAEDIRRADIRMLYENRDEYAAWRIRMGLDREPEGRMDPEMRARIAVEFRKLGVNLGR